MGTDVDFEDFILSILELEGDSPFEIAMLHQPQHHSFSIGHRTPSKSRPVLEVRGIDFSFGERQILNSIDLSIEDGRFVALLGPSGCGKTTLLNLISGVLKTSRGSLRAPGTGQIGYMFQEYPFLPRKRVREHISFPLLVRGKSSRDAAIKAEGWLITTDLVPYSNYRISSLSSGMKARVALATVMISEPCLILLDEPFHSLDLETRINMWHLIRKERARRKTAALIVTHDLNEAIVLADDIYVMSKPPSTFLAVHRTSFQEDLSPLEIMNSEAAAKLYQGLWSDLRRAFQGNL